MILYMEYTGSCSPHPKARTACNTNGPNAISGLINELSAIEREDHEIMKITSRRQSDIQRRRHDLFSTILA